MTCYLCGEVVGECSKSWLQLCSHRPVPAIEKAERSADQHDLSQYFLTYLITGGYCEHRAVTAPADRTRHMEQCLFPRIEALVPGRISGGDNARERYSGVDGSVSSVNA